MAFPPFLFIPSATWFAASMLKSAHETAKPSSASRSAIAFPIPWPAPVT